MARKKSVPIDIEEVRKVAPYLSTKHLVDYLGISEDTFTRKCKANSELMRAYKEAKAKTIASIGGSLVSKAMDGDLGAMIFYLKTQAGWREKEKDENTGSIEEMCRAFSELISTLKK